MLPRYDTKLFTEVWDSATDFVSDYNDVGIPTTITTQSATTLFYLLYARYGNNPIANYDEEQFKYKIFSIIFQYGPTWEKKLSLQYTLRGLELQDIIGDGTFSEAFSHTGGGSQTTMVTGSSDRTIDTDTTNTGTVTVDTDNTTTDINNQAANPSTTPATNAFTALNYIDRQTADQNVVDAYTTTTNDLAGTVDTTDGVEYSNTTGVQKADNATDSTTRSMTVGKLKGFERLLALLDADVTGDFISKFKICFKQFVMPERNWIYVTDVEEDDEYDG